MGEIMNGLCLSQVVGLYYSLSLSFEFMCQCLYRSLERLPLTVIYRKQKAVEQDQNSYLMAQQLELFSPFWFCFPWHHFLQGVP